MSWGVFSAAVLTTIDNFFQTKTEEKFCRQRLTLLCFGTLSLITIWSMSVTKWRDYFYSLPAHADYSFAHSPNYDLFSQWQLTMAQQIFSFILWQLPSCPCPQSNSLPVSICILSQMCSFFFQPLLPLIVFTCVCAPLHLCNVCSWFTLTASPFFSLFLFLSFPLHSSVFVQSIELVVASVYLCVSLFN